MEVKFEKSDRHGNIIKLVEISIADRHYHRKYGHYISLAKAADLGVQIAILTDTLDRIDMTIRYRIKSRTIRINTNLEHIMKGEQMAEIYKYVLN